MVLGAVAGSALVPPTSTLLYQTTDSIVCTGYGKIPPLCTSSFTNDTEYLPPSATLTELRSDSTHGALSALQQRVDSWVCGLTSQDHEIEDHGRTVGKLYFFWVKEMYDHTRRATKSRTTIPMDLLSSWLYMPTRDGCAAPDDWVKADSCGTGYSSVSSTEIDTLVQSMTDSGTASGLWWCGQLMRQALSSLGRCAKEDMAVLMQNSTANSTVKIKVKTATLAVLPSANATGVALASRPLTIGMHVRRGDSCMRWAERGDYSALDKSRPCYKLSVYMEVARSMKQQYGASRIAVATDSASVVAELASYSSEFDISYVEFDREMVGGPENTNMGKNVTASQKNFMEQRNLSTEMRSVIFSSALAEMVLLSNADMLIGTSASTVSRLALLAQVGQLGFIPPFAWIDTPMGCLYTENFMCV